MQRIVFNQYFSILLIAFTFCLISSTLVNAQSAFKEDAKDGVRDGIVEFPYDDELIPARLGLNLSRHVEYTEDHAVLIISPISEIRTGCQKYSDFGHEQEFKDIYLDVTLTGYHLELEGIPQDPHIKCYGDMIAPKAEIVITRESLESNNTKHINLKSGATILQTFDIDLNEDYILLAKSESFAPTADYFPPQTSYGRRNSMKLWFYPENTLILYMPGENLEGQNIKEKLNALAEKHGLEPLKDHIETFKSPLFDNNQFYFVDTKGDIASKIKENGPGQVDVLYADTISYELEGDVPALKEVQVYARTPGSTE